MGVRGWGCAKNIILKDLQVYCFDIFLWGAAKVRRASADFDFPYMCAMHSRDGARLAHSETG
jgi:hypothetical protein